METTAVDDQEPDMPASLGSTDLLPVDLGTGYKLYAIAGNHINQADQVCCLITIALAKPVVPSD